MARTQIMCGIVIPQYVNLKIYDYGFYTTISFHIEESIVNCLQKDCSSSVIKDAKLFVFSKPNSKGKKLYYYSIRRDFTNLNTIHDACWRIAHQDKLTMMKIIRKAKIESLKDQIDFIDTLF